MIVPEDAGKSPQAAVSDGCRPSALRLQHVALNVADLGACERFYCEILGMRVLWRPDEQNVYLTNGTDNLALHQSPEEKRAARESLDHIGFGVEEADAVDAWHEFLLIHGVSIVSPRRTHRDGTRSLYCSDPGGNTVQPLYEPRLAADMANKETAGRNNRSGDGGL